MSLMRWYAVLFWIWVALSVGIFLYRRVTGAGRTEEPDRDEAPSPLARQWAPPPRDADVPSGTDRGAASEVGTDIPEPTAPTPTAPMVDPPPTPGAPAAGRSLIDLLEGISLPHDLVPLTQAAASSGPITSLVASTTSATPEEVGTALADELERLGYTVAPTGDQTALAQGPRGAVEIEIHPDAARAYDGGAPRFPTAAPGSVVVELTVSAQRL
jgi:hypothetical protein